MDNIDEWAETLSNYKDIDRIRDLFTQLKINAAEVDTLIDSIDKSQKANIDPSELEYLYSNEFRLLMDSVGLYEDLMLNLDRIEKTSENELELARIKRDIKNIVRVETIEI